MKYDFYYSETQKDLQDTFNEKQTTFIHGKEFTECIKSGEDIREFSKIKDYVFVCTADINQIEYKRN